MTSEYIITSVCGISDRGIVRNNNEDSFILVDLIRGKSLADTSQIQKEVAKNFFLFVVSDGVGGSQMGELASELTVLSIKDALLTLEQNIPITDRLVAAVEQANHVVWSENIKNPDQQWMKATATAAVIQATKAYIATVGDSRAYIIRDGKIKQITIDQTMTGVLVSRGIINPEDADKRARSNVILQAIGNTQTLQVAITYTDLLQGDYLLLCSDGLSNKISNDELLLFATSYADLETACKEMVDMAKERGGEDNITVVLAKFEGQGLPPNLGLRLTGGIQQLTLFDPYAETKSSRKRTELLGSATSSHRKIDVRFPIEIKGVDTASGKFIERSETLQLGKMDASFLLEHTVQIDDLLRISLPMPRDLRLYDLDTPFYQIYVQVRKISPQAEGKSLIRVAFISKENPED